MSHFLLTCKKEFISLFHQVYEPVPPSALAPLRFGGTIAALLALTTGALAIWMAGDACLIYMQGFRGGCGTARLSAISQQTFVPLVLIFTFYSWLYAKHSRFLLAQVLSRVSLLAAVSVWSATATIMVFYSYLLEWFA